MEESSYYGSEVTGSLATDVFTQFLRSKQEPSWLEDNVLHHRIMIIDEGFYKGMRDKLYERFQSGASVILYDMGLGYGDIMGKDMLNMGVSKFETVTKFMELGKKHGYGEFHIPLLKSFLSTLRGEPVISIRNSFFATSVGHTGKPECYIMAGIIAGASSILLNKRFVCVEERCLCKGDAECQFRLKETDVLSS